MFYTLGLQVSRAQVTIALCSLPPGRAECVVTLTLTFIISETLTTTVYRYLHGMKTLKAVAHFNNFHNDFSKKNCFESGCVYLKPLNCSLTCNTVGKIVAVVKTGCGV